LNLFVASKLSWRRHPGLLSQTLTDIAITMLTVLSRSVMSARAFAKSPMQMFTFSTTPVVEKLKTHKGAAKRWKAIANGNVSTYLII
jgi:hypothetical protein